MKTETKPIRVLIAEDDPMVLDIQKQFVHAVPGFRVVGTAQNGAKALDLLDRLHADLLILDLYMPEVDGLEMLDRLRETRKKVDVVIVSAAHVVAMVKDVLRYGVFDYIVKPFTFERFKAALTAYRDLIRKILFGQDECSQEDIDRFFLLRNRKNILAGMPKGLNAGTLARIEEILRESRSSLSSEEVASGAGISRVTARRYLEYLVEMGKADVERAYREIGRPVHMYSLVHPGKDN